MCVGVPAKILEKDEYTAVVDVMGSTMKVGTIFVNECKVGDYVIVHAGQAMSIIDEEHALQSLEAWKLIAEAEATGSDEPLKRITPIQQN